MERKDFQDLSIYVVFNLFIYLVIIYLFIYFIHSTFLINRCIEIEGMFKNSKN